MIKYYFDKKTLIFIRKFLKIYYLAESILMVSGLFLLEFFKEYLGDIYVSYIGAKEYSVNEKNEDDKWLSKGIKEIRTVIGYPGFSDPTKDNHLLILFGFESDRTKRLINEFELVSTIPS